MCSVIDPVVLLAYKEILRIVLDIICIYIFFFYLHGQHQKTYLTTKQTNKNKNIQKHPHRQLSTKAGNE